MLSELKANFMIKDKSLILIIFVSVLAVILMPIATALFIYPKFTGLLMDNIRDDAIRTATRLNNSLLPENTELKKGALPANFNDGVEEIRRDFSLIKLKVFSPSGEVIYSTDPKEIGNMNKYDYFQELVAKGNNFTKIIKKDTKSLEGQTVTSDVAETYVPVMRQGGFAGAFEIYLDVTNIKKRSDSLLAWAYAVVSAVSLCLLAAVIVSSLKAGKSMIERDRAEGKIISQKASLEVKNSELEALHRVSSVLANTMDMDSLLSEILETVTGLDVLKVERKGGIFIVEGEKMRLASHSGLSDAFLAGHKDMELGKCPCGLAARTGEVVITDNCAGDSGHTITHSDIAPHGHITVPLKAMDRVVGVLCLFLPADSGMGVNKDILSSIGSQIGIAIENARLYEETKILSLKDPLTGLANRRLMDIVLDRSLAKAKRYGSDISVIMMDIDFFKKFNDTHGHVEGDRLLGCVAHTVLDEMRDVDLAVRYGGEEFLMLLPETGLKEVYAVAERIRLNVEKRNEVTVSLGVSSYRKGMRKYDLIASADEALYEAKNAGRNQVRVCKQKTKDVQYA